MNGAVWLARSQVARARPRTGGMRASTGTGIVSVLVVLMSGALPGCTPARRRNATFCDPDINAGFPCTRTNERCDPNLFTCVPLGIDGGMPPVDAGNGAPDVKTDASAHDPNGDAPADLADTAADDAGPSSDAPPMCGVCPADMPICDRDAGVCGPCSTNGQCALLAAGTPLCEQGTCVGCLTKDDCPRAAPLCSETTHACAGCQSDTDCKNTFPALPVCNGGACVECVTGPQCPAGTPYCNAGHTCAQCVTNDQCAKKNPAQSVCSGGACFECAADTDCGVAARPICVSHSCKPCTTDKQCATKLGADPGVCMFQNDGHCAIDGETLYVARVAACDDSNNAPASAAKPFCTVQRAILALSPAKMLIVIRPGTANLANWNYTRAAGVNELTVIGQNGATIGGGAGAGIAINSGTVYIRGLNVTAAGGVGISASGSDTLLKLDRCVVTKNNGGLLINGAGFEINNSVFAENTSNATAVPPVAFGGVYLDGGASKSTVFRNNTVYGNGAAGLVCGSSYVVRGLLVANNTGGQISVCDDSDPSTVTSGTAAFDPQFDPSRPYHLTAASRCVDRGSATDFPTDDLDGNPRPAGARSDCGAHELQPAP